MKFVVCSLLKNVIVPWKLLTDVEEKCFGKQIRPCIIVRRCKFIRNVEMACRFKGYWVALAVMAKVSFKTRGQSRWQRKSNSVQVDGSTVTVVCKLACHTTLWARMG